MVEVAFEAETLFVPFHRFLEGFHGVRALVELARLDVDGELHRRAGGGLEGVAQHVELAGDDGEQVGRFLERVPHLAQWRPSAIVVTGDRVAAGEQHPEGRLVGVQRHRVGRHHVRAVEEPGDAAEALRLALREIAVRGAVEAGQPGVVVRVDADDGAQRVKASGRSVRVSVPGVSVYGQSWPSTLTDRVCSSSPSSTSGWPGQAALRRMASVARTVCRRRRCEIEIDGVDPEGGRV